MGLIFRRYFVFVALLLLACFKDRGATFVPVKLPDNQIIRAELAETLAQRRLGLMFRKHLPEGEGMLFIFEKPGTLSMWMKDTLIDLDFVFLDGDRRIASIYANVPHSQPNDPPHRIATVTGFGRYVLELKAGESARHSLAVGQALDFTLP